MAIDSPTQSDTKNVSGDPAVWRRVFWTTEFAPDRAHWKEGSYIDIMMNGGARVFIPYVANQRTGDLAARWPLNYICEIHWLNTQTGKITGGPNNLGLNLRVLYNLQFHEHHDNVKASFGPLNDPNRGDADAFIVFRKILEDHSDPGGTIYIPLPHPDF